jgi:NitT/TauT family transport system ATP-binding protein
VSRSVEGGASTLVVRVAGLGKRYTPEGPMVLAGVTFDVAEGELLAIVGPSGCGKTTLLRMLCGLMPPSEGSLLLGGRPVVRPPREISLVFQDYSRSLFPWLDVLRNVMLPLPRLGLSRAERAARAEAALSDVGLNGVARAYPWQLSGGMQQRVAIARALVSRPEVVFLDEPFASVDARTRADLQDVRLGVPARAEDRRVSIVHVTHDVDEAAYLADRVLVLTPSPGKVAASIEVALARPRAQTATRSSARFLAVRNEIHDAIARQRSRQPEDR